MSRSHMFVLFALVTGCAMEQGQDIADETALATVDGKADTVVQPIAIVDDPSWTSDDFMLDEVRASGDLLEIDVAFTGGCARHDFALASNAHVYGRGSDPTPPAMVFVLTHDAHGDACEAWARRTLRFDLSAIARPERYEAVVFGNRAWKSAFADGSRGKAIATVATLPADRDAVSLIAARQVGDELELDVGYAGGCGEHELAMYWDGRVQESFPPVARLRLVHDARGDRCESFHNETLRFDLTSTTLSAPIRLRVEGGGSFVTVDMP